MALTVAFEGLPGSGKTTAIGLLREALRRRDIRVEVTDIETVGYAPVLRPITRTYPLGHPARIFLFWVLRLQQYDAVREMLDADVVFIDRFWGSTLAFDVYGHGMPRELTNWFGHYIKWQPDITFFLDAPLGTVRRRKKAKTMNDPGFAERVAQGYQELAREMSWTRVDATQKPEEVKAQCLEVILSRL